MGVSFYGFVLWLYLKFSDSFGDRGISARTLESIALLKFQLIIKNMKNVIILVFLTIPLTNLKAQVLWGGTTPGNIHYNSGNVGIGTPNPDMKLSIYSGDQFITRFHSMGSQAVTGLRIGKNSSYGDLVNMSTGFGIGAGTMSSNLPLDSQNPNYVYFFMSNSSGNIGIGTITPSYKAVVSNNGAAGIEIDPTGIQFSQGVGIQAYNRSTSAYLPFQIYSSKLVLDGGNVLVGKTNQVNDTYKLDVNGSIRSNEVVVNVTGADFVFQDNYNLKTLNEVERFIKDNKHLPDIEAADEMKEKGLELGKMDMKLLQKIEELTLYMIDLKRDMDNIKEENQKLMDKIIELEKD